MTYLEEHQHLSKYQRIFNAAMKWSKMTECPVCKMTVSKPCKKIKDTKRCLTNQLKAKS